MRKPKPGTCAGTQHKFQVLSKHVFLFFYTYIESKIFNNLDSEVLVPVLGTFVALITIHALTSAVDGSKCRNHFSFCKLLLSNGILEP